MTSQGPAAILEKKDGIAKVTLNRPEKRNPLSKEMQDALSSIFEEIRKDETIRVVTTTGAGDISFTAGMNVRELKYLSEHPGGIELANICQIIRDFPKVTIAVVNGYCLGAGVTFLSSHDLAIASAEKAQIGLPEIFRGFVPKQATAPLFRTTHMKWAFEMLLTGKNWDAQRAYQAGLINKVVPHADLQKAAYEWAKEIAQWDPIVLKYCKKAAYALVDVPTYQQAIDIVAYWHGEESRLNPRTREGLRAFVEGKGIKANK